MKMIKVHGGGKQKWEACLYSGFNRFDDSVQNVGWKTEVGRAAVDDCLVGVEVHARHIERLVADGDAHHEYLVVPLSCDRHVRYVSLVKAFVDVAENLSTCHKVVITSFVGNPQILPTT